MLRTIAEMKANFNKEYDLLLARNKQLELRHADALTSDSQPSDACTTAAQLHSAPDVSSEQGRSTIQPMPESMYDDIVIVAQTDLTLTLQDGRTCDYDSTCFRDLKAFEDPYSEEGG